MTISSRRAIALVIVIASAAVLIGATPASSYSVSSAERAQEDQRWSVLGLNVPKGGIVRELPYSEPLDNRSFVVPSSWYRSFYQTLRAKGNVSVNPDDLRKDLPTLKFLLSEAYSGYASAQRRGWNWDAMFANWDQMLTKAHGSDLTLEQAFAPWGDLERVQLDNHSGVPGLRAFVSGSRSAILASEPQASCSTLRFEDNSTLALHADDAGQQPHAAYVWNGSLARGWYVSYPSRLGTATSITCGNGSIAVRPMQPASDLPKEPLYRELAPGVGYLRMPTFTDANDDALRTVIAKTPNISGEKTVILDLRDNDGGNAPLDVLYAFAPKGDVDAAADQTKQTGTRSCLRTALFFGLQQQLLGQVTPPLSPELKEQLQSLLDGLQGKSTPNCDAQPVVTGASHSLADHHFAPHSNGTGPRLIALVNSGCGSDCEYMTYVIAQLRNSAIVGSSTYGVMGFTQPGYTVLPYSRVPFRLALSQTDEYGDGRSVDGYGITADVVLPTAQSQSDASLRALALELAK